MKAKLYKVLDQYHLYDGDKAIATTIVGNPMLLPNLSKQNCDEIFGVVDVEMLAIEYDLYEKINFVGQTRAYKAGFQKAMELNKDKLYTIEDMEEAIQFGLDGMYGYETGEDGTTKNQMKRFIQSLQQPTEIDVGIEMETCSMDLFDLDCDEIIERPKLDKNGCLILKRIEE